MALDPQAQEMLAKDAALGEPPLREMTPAQARAAVEAGIDRTTPRESVAAVEDREIPGPGGSIPVRIYTPKGAGPFPILLYFHGGGWVVCSIETHDAWCRHLTNRIGCIVVSVNYRQAPEHPFPAAVDDCLAVAQWAATHGVSFGGDGSRLAVGGDSAGGNLAAGVSLLARDRGGPAIAYQLLIYPVADYNFETGSYRACAEGYMLTRDEMQLYWELYLTQPSDGANGYASVLRADLAGLPPALVITAEYDPLRDEGNALAEKLRDAGVPVEHICYPGMIHGFFNVGTMVTLGDEAVEKAARSLATALA